MTGEATLEEQGTRRDAGVSRARRDGGGPRRIGPRDGDSEKEFSAAVAAVPSIPEDDAPADAAAEAWAGASPTVKITLTNLANPQALGSANISVPSGVTISPSSLSLTSTQPSFAGTVSTAGGIIKLRNLSLNPGKSVTLSVGIQATCAPTAPSYAFSTTVKQSNDFNGTGNDFVIKGAQPAVDLVGRCSLAFRAQPAAAQRATAITSEIYLPTGAPVTVAVRDGSGAADVGWWTAPIASRSGPTRAAARSRASPAPPRPRAWRASCPRSTRAPPGTR